MTSLRPVSREQHHPVQFLLPLKLAAPVPRPGVVWRSDMQALLSDVRTNPLSLVIAPAGYGKTTLLAQWAQELNHTGAPVCWLTLERGERDPAAFLAYLIGTVQTVFPNIGQEAERILHSAANLNRDWPLVAGALCNDLQRHVLSAAFLFLDDLHQISESAVITQIIGYLLRAAPPTLHIVIAARRAPTFAPLGRLRAEGRVLDISQTELHLSVDEVRQVLALQGVVLSEPELALLLDRTAGWALSTQLAARALVSQLPERRGDFVRALGGSQEHILNYLATEVLAELSDEMLHFLRLAAMPAFFDNDLLASVLDRDDVPYLLQRAQALGLPIMPMDTNGGFLRFHPLWRELLLRDISAAFGSVELAQLHQRFGSAFVARGELDAALDHYAEAHAPVALAQVLREHAWSLLHSSQREMVRRWLAHVPSETLANDAELLHLFGISQASTDAPAARAALDNAAALYERAGAFERELYALGDLMALLVWQSAPDAVCAVCLRAVRAAKQQGEARSNGAAQVAVATVLLFKHRNSAALRVARRAMAYPSTPAWRWLLAMVVGTVCCQLGRPAEALMYLDDALRAPQIAQDDRLRQNLLRLRAQALYQVGQTSEATKMALAAHRHLSDYYQSGVTGTSAAQVALLLALQGRTDETMTYLIQARGALGARDHATSTTLQTIEAYALAVRGQTDDASALTSGMARRLQEARGEADLRMWLLLAIAQGTIGQYARALALAQATAQRMAQQGYVLFLAATELYIAYLAPLCGKEAVRVAALKAGWKLIAQHQIQYVPMLPAAAVRDTALAAFRANIQPEYAGRVLQQHDSEHAVAHIQALLNESDGVVRANAARILGSMGAVAAYAALRGLLKDRDPQVRQAAEYALDQLVYRPPYTLRIRTLGGFGLFRGDQEVRDRDWRSVKARLLFQLLLTERGRTLTRDRIIDAIWPDMDVESASNNLRVTLNRLSKAIEPDRPDGASSTYIVQHGDTYSFHPSASYQLDTIEFGNAAAEGQRALRQGQRQAAMTALRQAVDLYQGTYLPEAVYEDWSNVERERLAFKFNEVAVQLGGLLLDEAQAHDAIGLAWRVLENDRANEDAYRLLMRAHAHLGQRSAALRLYARCVAALHEEFSVEPQPETVALYATLRDMR